jgi:hypothetical protein
MNKSIAVILFLLSATSAAFGQSDEGLSARFHRISAYEVSPGIIMVAKFKPNGQASELVFQKEHTTRSVVDLGSTLSELNIIDIIEKVIPEAERGKRIKGFLGQYDSTTSINGTIMETEYQYEKISVVFYGAVRTDCAGDVVAVVHWLDSTASRKSNPKGAPVGK